MQDRFISAGSDWSADTANVDSWGQSGRASTDTDRAGPADGFPTEHSLSTDLFAVSEALDESGEDHHNHAEEPEEHSDPGSSVAPAAVSPLTLDVKPPAAPRNLSPGTSLESIQESEEAPEAEEQHQRLLQAEDAIIEEEIERGGLSSADEDADMDDDDDDDMSVAASDASSEALALAVAANGSDLDEDVRESRGGRGGGSSRRSGGGGGMEKQGSVLAPAFSKGLTRLASLLPRRDGRGAAASSSAHPGELRGAFSSAGSLRASFMGSSSSLALPKEDSEECARSHPPCSEYHDLITVRNTVGCHFLSGFLSLLGFSICYVGIPCPYWPRDQVILRDWKAADKAADTGRRLTTGWMSDP